MSEEVEKASPMRVIPNRSKIDKNRQRRDALELRKAGASYADIGDRMGLSANAVRKMVNKAIEKMVTDSAGDMKAIMTSRMESLLVMAWSKAKNGDLRAIETCVRITERISALNGYDAPSEQNINHGVNGVSAPGGKFVMVIDGESEDDYIASLKAASGPTLADLAAQEEAEIAAAIAAKKGMADDDDDLTKQRRKRRKKIAV